MEHRCTQEPQKLHYWRVSAHLRIVCTETLVTEFLKDHAFTVIQLAAVRTTSGREAFWGSHAQLFHYRMFCGGVAKVFPLILKESHLRDHGTNIRFDCTNFIPDIVRDLKLCLCGQRLNTYSNTYPWWRLQVINHGISHPNHQSRFSDGSATQLTLQNLWWHLHAKVMNHEMTPTIHKMVQQLANASTFIILLYLITRKGNQSRYSSS